MIRLHLSPLFLSLDVFVTYWKSWFSLSLSLRLSLSLSLSMYWKKSLTLLLRVLSGGIKEEMFDELLAFSLSLDLVVTPDTAGSLSLSLATCSLQAWSRANVFKPDDFGIIASLGSWLSPVRGLGHQRARTCLSFSGKAGSFVTLSPTRTVGGYFIAYTYRARPSRFRVFISQALFPFTSLRIPLLDQSLVQSWCSLLVPGRFGEFFMMLSAAS